MNMVNMNFALNWYRKIDGFGKIQAAKYTTEKSDGEIQETLNYLSSYSNFKYDSIPHIASAHIKGLLQVPAMFYYFDNLAGLPFMCGLVSAVSVSIDSATSSNYLTEKKYAQDGLKLSRSLEFQKYVNATTRLVHFGAGIFFIGKSLYCFLDSSVSDNPVLELGIGVQFLTASFAQYIKDSDEKGLEKHLKEKEAEYLQEYGSLVKSGSNN